MDESKPAATDLGPIVAEPALQSLTIGGILSHHYLSRHSHRDLSKIIMSLYHGILNHQGLSLIIMPELNQSVVFLSEDNSVTTP